MIPSPVSSYTFGSLKDALFGLENQVMGDPGAVCETGEYYVAFDEFALSRPCDIEVIERIVASRMAQKVLEYINKRNGRIYWRCPFGSSMTETYTIDRFDESGHDIDPITKRRCIMDKNWRRLECYCRLYRANLQTIDKPVAVAA